MANRKKVAKYRKPININIGMIVFFILFIYVVINVIIYFNKDHMAIYEVLEKSIADDNTCKGVVLRTEEIVNTNKAGYVNYYLREGERAAKNSIAYTVDESGNIYELLTNSDNKEDLSTDAVAEIRTTLSDFNKSYSDTNYSAVYDLKYDLENQVLELNNFNMIQNLENIVSDSAGSPNFEIIKTPKSGIVTYSVDGMENLTQEQVTPEIFNLESYEKKQLRTRDLIEKGSPVYKLITSEYWSVILQLTKEQFNKLQEKEYIKITFLKDDLSVNVPVTVYQKGDGFFGKIDLDRYMVKYINDRFLDVELTINSAEGLKIPVSSKVEKDFYKVPLDYFTKGGDSDNTGIMKEVYKENGDSALEFIPAEKYYEDEEYGYIDTNVINTDDTIVKEGSSDRYKIGLTGKLDGVYNVNKGYCVFRRIEIIYANEEYYIIKNDTPYGLSAYDHIVLDGKLAIEQKIIY